MIINNGMGINMDGGIERILQVVREVGKDNDAIVNFLTELIKLEATKHQGWYSEVYTKKIDEYTP